MSYDSDDDGGAWGVDYDEPICGDGTCDWIIGDDGYSYGDYIGVPEDHYVAYHSDSNGQDNAVDSETYSLPASPSHLPSLETMDNTAGTWEDEINGDDGYISDDYIGAPENHNAGYYSDSDNGQDDNTVDLEAYSLPSAPSQLPLLVTVNNKAGAWEDEIAEDDGRMSIGSNVPAGYSAPLPLSPPAPKNETKVEYWEDKMTGNYRRETVTERTRSGGAGGGYIRYHTSTSGNKFTGESSWRQDREVIGREEGVNVISAVPERGS